MKHILLGAVAAAGLFGTATAAQTEYLTRGVVAVKADQGVFVSWRSLVSDAESMTFDLYRNGVKLNDTPISTVTSYSDPDGKGGDTYEVRAIVGNETVDTGDCTAWATPYMNVHLDRPEGGTVEGSSYTYTPDDVSVGDVDGDGVYELFVKWVPSNAKDSASKGFTGNTIMDCYKLDGTKLWRIDLGHNIRSGNHYTQFMVYDFDGDGSAEMICKTAPGTIDGKGNPVLLGDDKVTDDYRMHVDSPSKILGHVRGGSEYLTCFSGKTGENLSTIPWAPRYDIVAESVWGDNYCNRADRYLGCVAFLDGEHPTAIMCRGYYRCAFVWAVDFDGTELKERWLHQSIEKNQGLWGEGAHGITVGDVDGDGKDEIVYGAAALDDDGTLLYRTGAAHGDALHMTAMLPDREGMQVFMPHEEKSSDFKWDTEMRDALTGEIIFGKPQSGNDIGRGIAANVSAAYPGYEYWAASDANVYSYGQAIATNRPSINFRIYWDGDLLDELLDGTSVTKPTPNFSAIETLADFSKYEHAASCNGTKATPNLSADLFGDWREEVILHNDETQSDLLIFTTSIPTAYKVPCLLQNHQYRMAIAWQNCAYNQPPHLSYNLEEAFETHAALLLRSGALQQMVTLGDAIDPVVVSLRRATGVECSELPAGLTFSFDAAEGTATIEGTPAEEGDYTVTLTTTGAATEEDNTTMTLKFKVNKVVTLTPLAYYSFDKPGETVANHVSGIATAAGASVPTATEGKKGNAALFDGNSHYTQPNYETLALGDGDFTVEFWMNSTDDAAYIFTKGSHAKNDATGTTGNWVGMELKNGVLYFAIDDDVNKSQAYVKEAAQWFDGKWHHVVGVRDTYAKALILYVDGEEVARGADSTGAIADALTEPLVIANMAVNFDNNFAGALDEFYIYSGAMPADKVAERYASTGAESAYFPFDEVGETTPNLVYGSAVATDGQPAATEGLKEGAVEFADGAHYVQEAYDAIQFGTSDFTIEMWIRSTDNDGYIVFKGSHARNEANGTTGNWVGLERHSSGSLNFTIDDDVKKTDCKLADANYIFDGKWHHIACVRNYAETRTLLYVDGALAASNNAVATGALADNNEPLRIGISDEVARPYEGAIDELIIHPRALTAEEVKDSFDALNPSSGIVEVIATAADATYYVVDAMTGRTLSTRKGHDARTITAGLETGVYVLVIETPQGTETYKFVKK